MSSLYHVLALFYTIAVLPCVPFLCVLVFIYFKNIAFALPCVIPPEGL